MADALSTAQAALDAQTDALARALKEPPDKVRAALEAAAPAALASLIGQGEDEAGVETVRIALQDAQTGPELLTTLGARLDGARLRGRAGGAGARLLGARGAALIEQVASETGVKPISASALVDLTAPVLLAALRQAGGTPKDAESARTLLRKQAASVNRTLPDAFRPRFEIVLQPEPAEAVAARGAPMLWIVVALAALIAVALVLWLLLAHPAHAEAAIPAGAPSPTALVRAAEGRR